MKIYLASTACNRLFIQAIQYYLGQKVQATLEFVSHWYWKPPIDSVPERAEMDYQGVQEADIVIAFGPHGEGTTSEMGYALAQYTTVVYVPAWCHKNRIPLPAGMLHKYKGPELLDAKSPGWVVEKLEDLVEMLEALYQDKQDGLLAPTDG